MDDSTREETQQAEKRAREEVLTILIIPLLIAGAIALSYAIGFVNTRPKILPPEQIPDPPKPVAEFLGIDTETGFGVADLLIRGANGEIYTYTWDDQSGNKYFWQPASIPEEMKDFPCREKDLARIEAIAGSIAACRQVQPVSEWSPGPLVSFALAGNGKIYKLETAQSDPWSTWCPMAILVPIALIVGILIVRSRVRSQPG